MDFSSFTQSLQSWFTLDKRHARCLAYFFIALFQAGSVNLTRVARFFPSNAQLQSRYRRLSRFLATVTFSQEQIAHWIVQLFFGKSLLRLCVDRTQWQWGKTKFNFLVLACVHQGIALPLFWRVLPKKGNSHTTERIQLMQRFMQCFGSERIEQLLGDREFIGGDWFNWLKRQNIPFTIRIKDNSIVTNMRGLQVQLNALLHALKPGQWGGLPKLRKLYADKKAQVYLVATRSTRGQLCVVATDRCPEEALERYSWRWHIETLFSCLKTRGFRFEDTHVTHLQRLECFMGVLTIAVCYAHATGMWLHSQQPIARKRHGRLRWSLFRYGFDWIVQEILPQVRQRKSSLSVFCRFFRTTVHPGMLVVPNGRGDPHRILRYN